jgi:hypothetical protein
MSVCLCYIVPCGLSDSIIYFHIISYTARFSRGKKKITEQKMCFDFLYNFCLKLFSLRRIQRDIIINVHRSSNKVPVILVTF